MTGPSSSSPLSHAGSCSCAQQCTFLTGTFDGTIWHKPGLKGCVLVETVRFLTSDYAPLNICCRSLFAGTKSIGVSIGGCETSLRLEHMKWKEVRCLGQIRRPPRAGEFLVETGADNTNPMKEKSSACCRVTSLCDDDKGTCTSLICKCRLDGDAVERPLSPAAARLCWRLDPGWKWPAPCGPPCRG